MSARLHLAYLLCAFVATLPAGAVAKPGYVVRPGSFELSASLPKRDGFSYLLSASGHHRVELTVFRGSTFVTYAVRGNASAHGMHADFGRFGRVDLQVELKPAESPPPLPEGGNCTGNGPTLLDGSFRGSVRFAGEPGVEGVTARRGGISVVRDFRSVCRQHRHRHHGHDSGSAQDEKLAIKALAAESLSGGRTTRFETLTLGLQARPTVNFSLVFAGRTEKIGRVAISREALEFTEDVLKLSQPGAQPRTALATPPKPFLGSATFSQTADAAPTWSGDLGVHLPGAGLVPLAGPEFRARLCRGLSFDAVERCLQGSGSHSQPLAEARLSSLRYLRNSSSSAGSTLYTWSGSGKWRLRTSAP